MNRRDVCRAYLEDFRLIVIAVEHSIQALVCEIDRCMIKTSMNLAFVMQLARVRWK